jgi:hypothetical protein
VTYGIRESTEKEREAMPVFALLGAFVPSLPFVCLVFFESFV